MNTQNTRTVAPGKAWRVCDRGPPAPTPGRHAERLYEEPMGTYSQTYIVQTERYDQDFATSSARDRLSQERTYD